MTSSCSSDNSDNADRMLAPPILHRVYKQSITRSNHVQVLHDLLYYKSSHPPRADANQSFHMIVGYTLALTQQSLSLGSSRLFKSVFHCAGKMSNQKKVCMKMCRRGHKTQKKCDKISKIRSKELIFTVLRSKARILHRLWKFCADVRLCVCVSVFLPLLETLGSRLGQ